jgi:hypothetical protein
MSVNEAAAGSAEADARILEAAAAVLLRRYGSPLAGSTVSMLARAACELREEGK